MNPVITVLCDTREQRSNHLLARLSELNIPFKNKKLDFGDYSFEHNGQSFEKISIIERKQNLSEIAGNFTTGRLRFETEFAKATAAGCKVTLLIEDEDAKSKLTLRKELDKIEGFDEQKKLAKTWKSRFTGNAMIASIKAFKERYNLDLIFCSKKKTADEMLKVFYKAIDEYEAEAKLDESQIQRTASQMEENPVGRTRIN